MFLSALIFSILIIWLLYWFIKKMNTPLSEEAKAELKKPKKRVFNTEEFKVKKKINNGDAVKLYPIDNSNKVNLYELNSYGGNGFLYKIYDANVCKATEENRVISAKIYRTEKNKAYAKIIYR